MLGVVVPFWEREHHLAQLRVSMRAHMRIHHPSLHYVIVVSEPEDDAKPFNRGMMKNIGFLEAEKVGCTHCAFHDVDMLPMTKGCDYSAPEVPARLASQFVTTDLSEKPRNAWRFFFGGVVIMKNKHFRAANGYSNEYWGWGAEDEDLRWRLLKANIGLAHKLGVYKVFRHPSHRNIDKDLPGKNADRLRRVKAGEVDISNDGLLSLSYEVVSTHRDGEVLRVRVRI